MQFRVQPEIFERFPELQVVAVAHDPDDIVERPAIAARWRTVWAGAKAHAVHGNAQSHPRTRAWREQFQALGVSAKKHPSSIEAVLQRALKAGSAPFFINPADSAVTIDPSEMGYVASTTMLTRHIMWRQSREARITRQTTSLILLSEVLREFDTPDARIANVVLNEFMTGMRQHFDVEMMPFIVSPEQPEIEW